MNYRDEELINKYLHNALTQIHQNESISGVFRMLLIDGELYNHSVNVAKLSTQLALNLKYSNEDLLDICLAGLLHDIGKIYTPKSILYKPDKLSEDEFEIIKKHPIDGYKLCKRAGVDERICQAVLNHHKKSSGYPEKVTELSPFDEIIATADIFSAVSEPRVYHQARDIAKVFELINTFDYMNKDYIRLLHYLVSD